MSSFRGDMLPYLVKKQWKKRTDLSDASNDGGDGTATKPAEGGWNDLCGNCDIVIMYVIFVRYILVFSTTK